MNWLEKYQAKINETLGNRYEKHFAWTDYAHSIFISIPIGLVIGIVFGMINTYLWVSIAAGIIHGIIIGLFLTLANQVALYFFSLIPNKAIAHSLALLVMAICAAVGTYLINFVAHALLNIESNSRAAMALTTVFYIAVGMLIYSKILQKDKLDSKITEQEVKLLELKQLKTQAELDALHAKVNPHFLYNALNSIASLIHVNPDKAEEMTLLLSKFFRYNTNRQNHHLTTLGEELEMVETYLEIEKVRFGNRLKYHLALPDTARQYLVPRFLLQPLVENAIKHGISKLAEAGKLSIEVTQEENLLEIILKDNGPAFSENMQLGYGWQSTRDKLELLFPKNADFYFENTPEKKVVISLKKMLAHEHTSKPIQIVQNPGN
ncbi:hypothetical protein BKI52_34705 [marine bacterium AO1-C]|nr:hypothetical protein BKI52_34705 [marine bacterium AO1-C]